MNTYGYVDQNPLSWIDLFGLSGSFPSLIPQGYNSNDTRGGFDENGNSLIFHPYYYDPSGASEILLTGVATAATGFTGKAILQCTSKAFGPSKQWLRFGPSYSKALGDKVAFSMRWGASPAKNGKYIKQIGSKNLQKFNQWLRGKKLPGSNWRTSDSGHLHLKR